MKKTNYFILAAAAALFAACSSDDGLAPEQQPTAQTTEQVPVGFSAYVNRGTTRAGANGDIVSETSLQNTGFGIFAYYTNSDTYDPIYQPNFMYNQKVTYSSGWTYTPVKYWPNEFLSANAEENDKVSFFAYAPYVASTATGKLTDAAVTANPTIKDYGIVGFSRNTAASDPLVKYIASFDLAKQVDLLWGVADPSTDVTWNLKDSKTQTIKKGFPWLNVQHPANLDQAMKFYFQHALARLVVDVDLYADAVTATAAASGTKVFIRSVTFTGFATKGALNLNNAKATEPLWLSADGSTDIESGQEITIHDGRKDGKEGLFEATNEKAFINPALIQTSVWNTEPKPGVTNTAVNLFNTSVGSITSTDPIYVIPTGDKLKVTIVYDVLTADPNLPGYLNDGETHGSVVTNTITKEITPSTGTDPFILEGTKQYTVHLHIGLQEVDVEATVANWGDAIVGSADLPENTAASGSGSGGTGGSTGGGAPVRR